MKVHLGEPQVLLLQRVGNAGKVVRKQGTQVAFFAADEHSNIVGVDDGAHFHVAEGRSIQTDPHLRLGCLIDHLSHLYRTSARIHRKLSGGRQSR